MSAQLDDQQHRDQSMCETMTSLALAAGVEIMRFFGPSCARSTKDDGSPVTVADQAAEAVIVRGLKQSFPDIAIVAEEQMADGIAHGELGREFFLVDPLDGTREFIAGRDEFTVNIALIRDCEPVIGVVYVPVKRQLFTGIRGDAKECTLDENMNVTTTQNLQVRAMPGAPTIVASRSHRTADTDAFIGKFEGAQILSVGSSLKFCMVARGSADLYPCFGRTMEWDTAAGQAVLAAAGGRMRRADGSPFVYGKTVSDDAPFANPWFIADSGDRAFLHASGTPS
ncbi:3'(2'),5'-bisphosphate nucleotidase CysQ [Paraburkholderia sp.]|uniref:3'(2'),5'-bisphosphate nucleotidase CysQ n=1 Tax=Paraburkholderia sp. TaxID=1926495 RepID=UPI0023937338|nr:3'(2'),5'-bisphosphate nucleotidase CysQ [Paraburkholderia sp.]MDE1180550.1 3'(2'),5'-bisphosphate nucleotidase CysQ [Paraburkholderia sp.]